MDYLQRNETNRDLRSALFQSHDTLAMLNEPSE